MLQADLGQTDDLGRLGGDIERASEGASTSLLESSPSAERLSELDHQLRQRLDSGSMDSATLLLEWRYDVALLLDHWRHWIFDLDRSFNRNRSSL